MQLPCLQNFWSMKMISGASFIPTVAEMKKPAIGGHFINFPVGTTGFEPATSCTPCKRATGLRYVPNSPVSGG